MRLVWRYLGAERQTTLDPLVGVLTSIIVAMFTIRIAVGVAVIAAPIVLAMPAQAQPVTFGCSPPCTGAPWTDFFNEVAPWEPFFDSTNGVLGDKKGAWESGVEAINGGSWEKAFPPAP